jgi:phage terminase Nu1 subunit (DNA packaging protein)
MGTKDMNELNDILVPSKVLEALFGVKDRTIRYLADNGIVKRGSHGKYWLMDSAKSYILTLKIGNAGKVNTEDQEGDLDLDTEKALHEHVKRQITEIKLQLIKGQVHKAEDVEAVMANMFEVFRQRMTALPAKLARKLEGKPKTEIQRILKNEIDSALKELAAYNPADFWSDEHIDIPADAINTLEEQIRGEK